MIQLVDFKSEEAYNISLTMNALARDILNKLSSIEKFGWISISVYKNKAGYPAVAVRNDDELVGWKLDIEEMKALTTKAKVGKKEVLDYSKLEEKLYSFID
jgi:hypothetical protein